jgi:cell division protein FtsW (lipid II flippase)
MTDVWGNPEPHRVLVPLYSYPARHKPTPYPGLFVLAVISAVVAFLYVVGLISAFPRSGAHDAILAAAFGLCFAAGTRWEAVRKIPCVGTIIYVLPALALAILPFALDFYLMFVR